MKHCPDVLDIH